VFVKINFLLDIALGLLENVHPREFIVRVKQSEETVLVSK